MTVDEEVVMSTGDGAARGAPDPPGYPSSWEFDGLLTGGEAVLVRPIQPADAALLGASDRNLSHDAIQQALLGAHPAWGPDEASHVAEVDYDSRMAFVAIVSGQLVAFASYDRLGPTQPVAEVAFVVAGTYQRHGVATLLFESLAAYARTKGIVHFVAEVMAENSAMLQVFGATGLRCTRANDGRTVRTEIDLRPTPEYRASCDEREATAEVASISAILRPRSIAVIGAGRHPGNVGHEVVRSLLAGDFSGSVYPVNPSARAVCGVPAFPTLSSLPEPIDLAIIAVPSAAVPGVLGEAASTGVRAATIITAGFGETGRSGAEVEAELLRVARRQGMRIVGPNCLGVVNTDPDIRMSATFAALDPLAGGLALVSQSGAVGIVLAEQARVAGLGLSSFVSVGNNLDVSLNDLLCYFERDDRTSVIALYLESLGNPRKFARITRRVGRQKPILVVKSGRSSAGARATSSHTGALLGASDVTVDALFNQAGVIRTDTLGEFFDVATLLANQPRPKGNRVAILTNGGGPGILCADACEADGLIVPQVPDELKAKLAEFLPADAGLNNPVDMIAAAPGESYRKALKLLAEWDGIDAVIILYVPVLVTNSEEIAAGIRAAALEIEQPVPMLSVFLSSKGTPDSLKTGGLSMPSYPFPEDAARALAHAVRYGVWAETPEGVVPRYEGIRTSEAKALMADVLASLPKTGDDSGSRWLLPDEVAKLLGCYDIPMAEWRLAPTAQAAGAAAEEIGGKVALKGVAPKLIHKTEAKAVVLNLEGAAAVTQAATEMAARIAAQGTQVEKFFVQQMVPSGGVEMLVGVVHDKLFGPVVACGAGGTAVEVLKDVKVRITPLTDRDAHEMVTSLRTFPLLDGFRGAPKCDVAGLEDLLLRVSAMVEHHPEILEMDCNPVIVLPEGAVIVDARIRIQATEA